jgi:hypothetical protein
MGHMINIPYAMGEEQRSDWMSMVNWKPRIEILTKAMYGEV